MAHGAVGLADGTEVPFAAVEDRRSFLGGKDRGQEQQAREQQYAPPDHVT